MVTGTHKHSEKALKELKIKKTYGIDNISAELLQALDEEIKYTLYCLISNIYTTGKFLMTSRKV